MTKSTHQRAVKAAAKPTPETAWVAASAAAPRVRRTDAALNPSTVLESVVSRALDQELEWFFVYAETALRRASVELLPGYVAARVMTSSPTQDAVRGKALELAQTVKGCLLALADPHASILRAVYTPRRWPKNVEAEFQALAPVVVRIVVASDPWPARSAHTGLEEAAAARLSARLIAAKSLPVVRLKSRASRLFGAAVIAYTKLRALEAPALGLS